MRDTRQRARARRGIAVALTALAACSHGEPFAPPDTETSVPFEQAEPVRATFSRFNDLSPAWLPDGSGFLYSFISTDTPLNDRCLGVLPASGGRRTREICRRAVGGADTVDVYDLPAVSSGGRLAWYRAAYRPGSDHAAHAELVAATLDDPHTVTVLRSFPFTGPGATLYVGLERPHWVGESALVFLGQIRDAFFPCPTCDPEFFTRPSGILHVTVGPEPVVTLVPGSETATGVAAARGAIFFTLSGDSRIFRREAPGGEDTVVHDFGTSSPTVLDAAGSWLLAIGPDGMLHAVNLDTGGAGVRADPGGGHPAISPDGSRIVAEVFGPGLDSDLWIAVTP
ncbi:MAG TPA: hypothetical protein VK012_04395 [Gemmatimonadales bacterium]|nr:hypothetical protein [Gemmatimonadales bacterium]